MATEKTMQLNDAAIPIVTSLGTTDTLLACDSAGGMKRISKDSLISNGTALWLNASKQGWYRIASLPKRRTHSIVLCITSGWHYSEPSSMLLHGYVVGDSTNASQVRFISEIGMSNIRTITKMRFINAATSMHIDLWYDVNVQNMVLIDSLTSMKLLNSIEEVSTPSDATIKEIDFKSLRSSLISGGGKNRCQTDSYILLPAFANHFEERRAA